MTTTKYEMIVVVGDDENKRQHLCNAIDMALCAGGARIGSGSYEVVIRRLSKKEVADIEADEMTLRRAGEGI